MAGGVELAREIYHKAYEATVLPTPDAFIVAEPIGGTGARAAQDGDPLLACAGLTFGTDKPLFSEHYLDRGIETEIERRFKTRPDRRRVVEVGALATRRRSVGGEIIRATPIVAWCLGMEYILCTVTTGLTKALDRAASSSCRSVRPIPTGWDPGRPSAGARTTRTGRWSASSGSTRCTGFSRPPRGATPSRTCSSASSARRRPGMRAVERALREHAESERPFVEVLGADRKPERVLTYRQVTRAAQAVADLLAREHSGEQASGARPLRVGVVCGNTPAFVIADLALVAARAVEVPVPLAFSAEQAASLLEDVDVCLMDAEGRRRMADWGQDRVLRPDCALEDLDEDELLAAERPLLLPDADDTADWECKVIHTSGTTSRPKGVRIRARALDALLRSLRTVMPPGAFTRYLSVVPFSLLIEQVTGLYMVLLDGGTLVQLPPATALVGTSAAASYDALPFIAAARPTALVATPALVDAFGTAADSAADAGTPVPLALFGTADAPLLCCGGAPVHPDLLSRLERHGLPVHEGYGLSENSSVVAWNTPGARRNGTVGRPLPHVRVRLADDGELLVKSTSLFAGYTRDDPSSLMLDADGWLRTGDLARIDEDGFISITGRKKNVIITAGGRNVAPEWVEAQYLQLPFVRAVAVVGDGMAALHGLFVVADGTDLAEARNAVHEFGKRRLSDVERIAVPHLVTFDEHTYRTYFTVTGRPMRAAIAEALGSGTLRATAGAAEHPTTPRRRTP